MDAGIVRFWATKLVLVIAMPAATPGVELRSTHTIGTPREKPDYGRRIEFDLGNVDAGSSGTSIGADQMSATANFTTTNRHSHD
jgi:hypothetical protein